MPKQDQSPGPLRAGAGSKTAIGQATPQDAPSGTLVLALGNPLRGDDGLGAAILEALGQAASLPQEVALLDGGAANLGIVLLMQGYRKVIIVDAAEMARVAGEWARFTPEAIACSPDDTNLHRTLHNSGLAEALALGEALGVLPPEIVIYGVQPLEIGWSPGLSEPAQKAIWPVCAAILEELVARRDVPDVVNV